MLSYLEINLYKYAVLISQALDEANKYSYSAVIAKEGQQFVQIYRREISNLGPKKKVKAYC